MKYIMIRLDDCDMRVKGNRGYVTEANHQPMRHQIGTGAH
jgi:hypothetical protein